MEQQTVYITEDQLSLSYLFITFHFLFNSLSLPLCYIRPHLYCYLLFYLFSSQTFITNSFLALTLDDDHHHFGRSKRNTSVRVCRSVTSCVLFFSLFTSHVLLCLVYIRVFVPVCYFSSFSPGVSRLTSCLACHAPVSFSCDL